GRAAGDFVDSLNARKCDWIGASRSDGARGQIDGRGASGWRRVVDRVAGRIRITTFNTHGARQTNNRLQIDIEAVVAVHAAQNHAAEIEEDLTVIVHGPREKARKVGALRRPE